MKSFACVFPGQGSQSVGMLDAWGDHPAVQDVLQEASAALDQDLGALIKTGTKEELSLTINTQPVMLVAGVAAWRVWQKEVGIAPKRMAGHSLGEYSALVAADALSLMDAVKLVRARAQFMQEAVPEGVGAMAAIIGLNAQDVIAGCKEAADELKSAFVVEAVNFNDNNQTVIAGHKTAVEKACEVLKAKGAKRALMLPVSAPFHSSLMQGAGDRLKEQLSKVAVRVPSIPVINNVDVVMPTDPDAIRDALYRQAFRPVRWVELVGVMRAQGIHTIVECGPGKVLAGLCKRIHEDLTGLSLMDSVSLQAVKEAIQ